MRLLLAALLLAAFGAQAQTFKCSDAAGKITYSSTACKELGLKDAGQIENRIQVTPAPVLAPSQPSPAARPTDTGDRPAPPVVAREPQKEPERRCFTVKTAKGTTTRCNDKPDEQQ